MAKKIKIKIEWVVQYIEVISYCQQYYNKNSRCELAKLCESTNKQEISTPHWPYFATNSCPTNLKNGLYFCNHTDTNCQLFHFYGSHLTWKLVATTSCVISHMWEILFGPFACSHFEYINPSLSHKIKILKFWVKYWNYFKIRMFSIQNSI